MPTRSRVIWAVFKRNFASYFINPTGYVFITVFILLGAMAAFWQQAFFMSNLANLDQLNNWFPFLLLFFIPALTMNVWAEERKQGTDELLLTLPGHDADIVLGKYLAALGIYTVAVLFSLSHLLILTYLGDPDVGLMIACYFGYWITGAALVAVGMVASLLTANATVAFILAAMFCGFFVFIHNVEEFWPWRGTDVIANLGIVPHFRLFGDGVIPLASVVYFVCLAAVMLYLNVVLLGRRHFGGGEGSAGHTSHFVVRTAALAVAAVAFVVLVDKLRMSADATAERLHTLQPQTREIIRNVPADRPVFIQAYFSKDAPEAYVQTRKDLLNLLHQFDQEAGDRIYLNVYDTEPYTEAATKAAENYNITARKIPAVEAGQRAAADTFLGLVFSSGPEEFVIPFFDRGLPVEYELARSIRVVSQEKKKKLGIVATDAKLFGGFDFESMQSPPDWSVVEELRKQYDVQQVAAAGPYPEDLDALMVVLPSSLGQADMDRLHEAILAGTPTLLFDDPLPMFNPQLSPKLPKDSNRNPFMSQGRPPPEQKGDFLAVLHSIGLDYSASGVVWSEHNPHPAIADAPKEIVFIAQAPDNRQPFNDASVISSGLQEVVALYPGYVRGDRAVPGATLERVALMKTGSASGNVAWDSLIERGIFGLQFKQNPRRLPGGEAYTLAMMVTGTLPPPATAEIIPPADEEEAPKGGGADYGDQVPTDQAREQEGGAGGTSPSATTAPAASQPGPRPIKVIMVSDCDMISETFFNLRRQGFAELNFDNVTFALNCIDVLAGDESFVALRKHRPQHRTLTRVEELVRGFADASRSETDKAEDEAAGQLVGAQKNLDAKVEELRQRTDLDEKTKNIMLRSLEQVENRRLDVQKAKIEEDKQRIITKARTEMEVGVAGVQRTIKWWAALVPPIPALMLAVVMFAYRYNREKIGVSERRLVGAK